MTIVSSRPLALVLTLALWWASPSIAGHSVLIWPVDPVIIASRPATELWVENRGENTTLLQIRIFAWRQTEGAEHYQTQQHIQPTPAMVRLEAGHKQVIRLFKQIPPLDGREEAYRVLIDEIPLPRHPADPARHMLDFQMRYSIPLFVYGPQSSPEAGDPRLSWRLGSHNGKAYLEIANRGPIHARLSKARLGRHQLTDGLLGYVLAHSSRRWPLSVNASPRTPLEIRIDNRALFWRGVAESG
ncbi:fimbrial biogenesis chaperone [Martelella alba]|uniref:Molecular chaperone n=1 Tax=Martelella alba TaxID=2590451 RepID=A0ABY2SMY4_9HYPH|nr:molecular chaperone [Martelella alba]TKI07245.1 molecular chaperone [Martelella alba]